MTHEKNQTVKKMTVTAHTHSVPPKTRREALNNGCLACELRVSKFRASNRDYDAKRRGVEVSQEELAQRRAARMAKFMPETEEI